MDVICHNILAQVRWCTFAVVFASAQSDMLYGLVSRVSVTEALVAFLRCLPT